MILAEAIQRVQSMYSKGVASSDTRLRTRHIYSALKTARSVIIRNQSSKNQLINEYCYQNLPCIALEEVPLHECPCAPPKGCKFLRTKNLVPSFISSLDRHLIKSVHTIDNSSRFDPTEFENFKWAVGNKYTASKPQFFLHNERLWLTNRNSLQYIASKGLFNDPVEAYLFGNSCAPDPCIDIMSMRFPMDEGLADGFYKLAYNELIIMFKQMNEDRYADAADDSTGGGSMVHQPQEQPEE